MRVYHSTKMGASVVVFSSTDSKHAIRLGATEFYATKGVESFEIAKLDHLLVTTSFIPDWKPFLAVMKPKSTIYPLTISFAGLVIPMISIVLVGIKIQGRPRLWQRAPFTRGCSVIEKFPLTKSGGMARLREGKMRYRGVLVAA
ncbi:hypothetical protein B0H14DRAFT_2543393 [Mycena olivaceomarginata]|nr:hypothetical protein B0H14DRAFT_2543393 [Mycena olivaceomarginata]